MQIDVEVFTTQFYIFCFRAIQYKLEYGILDNGIKLEYGIQMGATGIFTT